MVKLKIKFQKLRRFIDMGNLIKTAIKVKEFIGSNKKELFISASFILMAFIAFGLGRMSALEEQKYPIWFEEVGEEKITTAKSQIVNNETQIEKVLVGSKNSDIYYYTWCSGVKRIKQENKIYFSSKQEAEKLGYKPASNCEGL